MTSFIPTLAAWLAEDRMREKLVLAPSHRVGRQWLDQAAGAAGGIVNVRSTTIDRLLVELAEADLRRRGLRIPRRQEKVRLIGLALAELAADPGEDAYFATLPPGVEVADKFLSTLEELDSAGVRNTMGVATSVFPPAKARELARLARRYDSTRRTAGLAAPSDVHDAALRGLAALTQKGVLPLLIAPGSVLEEFTPLEWGFLSRWPDESRRKIEDGEDGCPADLAFFRANSVLGEAREVLRRIQAAGVPLDSAEVVCADPSASAPALCAAGLQAFGGKPEDLPITFNSGFPGTYARPVRLLAAWVEWLENGLPPEGLARMIEVGLPGEGWRKDAPGPGGPEVAAWIRSLPLDGQLSVYTREFTAARPPFDAAGAWLSEWLGAVTPPSRKGRQAPGAAAILTAAERLLSMGGDRDGKLDAYARRSLREAIGDWLPFADWPGFNALAWLGQAAQTTKVMGLGPMPGRLHVSDLSNGGHSGRSHLFVIGMDDGHYPGGARQDPVLLDRERLGISSGLFRSPRRRELREKAFQRLLARAKGTVTLSYARTETGAGREIYPAGAFAALLAQRGGSLTDSSLAPSLREASLGPREDWLTLLLGENRDGLSLQSLAPWFPRLASGEAARVRRLSPEFTHYDGWVPEAGADWLAGDRLLSPSHLETLAKCPHLFFFQRILGIKPPERFRQRPGVWLDGNVRGDLLHTLFQDFITAMVEDGRELTADNLEEHAKALRRLLDQALKTERTRRPPADHLAGEREERELWEACVIFLVSEVERQARGRPICLEASLGGAKEDRPPWNRVAPVEIPLAARPAIRLQGRVDRVDRLHDHGGLTIIDYKSGRSDEYGATDPFRQGRLLQPYLYTRMLESILAEAGVPEPVRWFEYFFMMPRDEGRRVAYDRKTLGQKGSDIVERLAALLADGRFPYTTDANGDLPHDYEPLFGAHRDAAAASAEKTRRDPLLTAWAELRGVGMDGEDADDED